MKSIAAVEAIPLERGEDGVIRLRGSRVTLDTLRAAYLEGASAEEISLQYPSLSLADIYQALGYYLRHESELEADFQELQQRRQQIRRESAARHPIVGVRQRLEARRRT